MYSVIHGVVYRLGVEEKYSFDRSVTGNTVLISIPYEHAISPDAS
jgi:hypothetical protein